MFHSELQPELLKAYIESIKGRNTLKIPEETFKLVWEENSFPNFKYIRDIFIYLFDAFIAQNV